MKFKDPKTGEYKDLYFKTGDTLPVGTIVEYDGDEVPPGYEEVPGVVASVVVSPTEPTTGEKVWIDDVNKKIYIKNDNDEYEEFYNEEEVNKQVYSTEEQRIGTWIDGKPIYRKVITFETSDNCNITHAHNIVNADKLWINEGASFVYINDPANWKQEVVGLNWYYSDTEWTRAWLNFSAIRYRASFNIGVRTAYVVIEYTKTTD